MPDTRSGNRGRDEHKIVRIKRAEASRILARTEQLLESSDIGNALRAGFGEFLRQLDEAILQLAIQPDSWGERTRARLVTAVMDELKGVPTESACDEEIADTANIVTPCLLFEIGRRRQHIDIAFPENPCATDSHFQLAVEPSGPRHEMSLFELARLVGEAGEELVGLCYFGDEKSRALIAAKIGATSFDPRSGKPSCRSRPTRKSEN